MKLKPFGFNPWFKAPLSSAWRVCGFTRVSFVGRASCPIKDESKEVPADLSGKLAYRIDSPMPLPRVGDWVTARYCNNDAAPIIHRVFP